MGLSGVILARPHDRRALYDAARRHKILEVDLVARRWYS